jgi:hypothetical protein
MLLGLGLIVDVPGSISRVIRETRDFTRLVVLMLLWRSSLLLGSVTPGS